MVKSEQVKNILIIIPKLTGGGAERIAAYLSIILEEIYNVYVIVYDDTKIDYDYGGNLISLNAGGSRNRIKQIINYLSRFKKLKRIKAEKKIDLSISFLDNPNIVNILTKGKEKVLVSVRNYKSKEEKGVIGFINRFLIQKFYGKADKIVTLSKGVAFDLIENFKIDCDKITTIYNLCDLNKITSLAEEKIDSNESKIFERDIIITSGRLTEQKGQWHIIKVFKELSVWFPNLDLVILGEGKLKNDLIEMCKKMGISDKVHFLGFVKNPFKYISRSKIFAFTSHFEGFGNVIVEAMACRTVVVSTDCDSGPREIISDDYSKHKLKTSAFEKYGVLVPVSDAKMGIEYELDNEENELFLTLKYLLNNPNIVEYYELLASKRVLDYSFNNISVKWLEVIHDLSKEQVKANA